MPQAVPFHFLFFSLFLDFSSPDTRRAAFRRANRVNGLQGVCRLQCAHSESCPLMNLAQVLTK
jgi:hypothetical protein